MGEKKIPYYGLSPAAPVFEGMSRYRPPFNFELSGKHFKLVFDDGETFAADFTGADTLVWTKIGGESCNAHYECVKADDSTYFVNFEFNITLVKPRTCITLALDTGHNLVTKVTTWTRFDEEYPTMCNAKIAFGAIAVDGIPLPAARHAFTKDLLGKRIHWHYAPDIEIIHVYYNEKFVRVTFPEGKGWGDDPEAFLEEIARNPYDEKARYVKIKKNLYLISVLEQNLTRRGIGGNSLVFLIDTERVHDVGRSFGHALPDFKPENYIFGAYGDFVYSDGILEAEPNKYI